MPLKHQSHFSSYWALVLPQWFAINETKTHKCHIYLHRQGTVWSDCTNRNLILSGKVSHTNSMYRMYFMPAWSGLTQSLNWEEALWLWRLIVPVGFWGLIQPYNTKESHRNMCAIDTDPNHYIYCTRKMYDSVSSRNEVCSQIDLGFHQSGDNSSTSKRQIWNV